MRRLFPILALLLAAMVAAEPAAAQIPLIDFIRKQFERKPAAEPNAAPQPTTPKPRRRASKQAAPAPAAPKVPPSHFVVVIGDSLAEPLGAGLETELADRPDIAVTRRAKSSSGLVRDDFHDWPAALDAILSEPGRIDAVVVMLGSNDRQAIDDAAGAEPPGSERWRTLYAARIDALLARASARKVPVIWAGLPPMRASALNASVAGFNTLYRDRSKAAGATFVDLWDAFSAENGGYTMTGPGIDGRITRLRSSDGVHFSPAGARLAAHFVGRELRKQIGEAAPAVATAPMPGRSAVSGVSVSALDFQGPGVVEGPPAPPPPRIFDLDALDLAGGGQLAGGPDGRSLLAPTSAAAAVLIRGEPLPPVPGRADDFRWPPPSVP